MTQTLCKPIQLGDVAPDFTAESTQGRISFHDWLSNSWAVLFSHPKDFTPVCTTELGLASKLTDEFKRRGVKIIGLSVGSIDMHNKWIPDINNTQGVKVNFPIIADENRQVAELYGMIHPKASDTFTVRTVFIIDPQKKVRLTMTYPASTGRNFKEILRVIDSLQMTDNYKVATPVNWVPGDECVILPSITDKDEIKRLFPKGYKELTPYLRLTPDPTRK